MSFVVGDFVEHRKLPHIWKITEIKDGEYLGGLFAKLELLWTPPDFVLPTHPEGPLVSLLRTIFEDVTSKDRLTSLRDLRTPSNEMLVIALESRG
jgi:hypothetical protein